MIARFYRGPWADKKLAVPDDQYMIAVPVNNMTNYRSQASFDSLPPYAQIETRTHYYRRTNHTHPDGSVFFEWEKKKGSKI